MKHYRFTCIQRDGAAHQYDLENVAFGLSDPSFIELHEQMEADPDVQLIIIQERQWNGSYMIVE